MDNSVTFHPQYLPYNTDEISQLLEMVHNKAFFDSISVQGSRLIISN